ncbi:uncharacterized protein TrAFT101_006305 [Trichoderma asperellum]|uniref:uncharacterized protein n=1 Tax=Trichoderma asperellum TaxID=101201 RepID=UPI003331B9C9|nr:hypothetical protein TrAFT101_006305 [Trichoderma asperellum]
MHSHAILAIGIQSEKPSQFIHCAQKNQRNEKHAKCKNAYKINKKTETLAPPPCLRNGLSSNKAHWPASPEQSSQAPSQRAAAPSSNSPAANAARQGPKELVLAKNHPSGLVSRKPSFANKGPICCSVSGAEPAILATRIRAIGHAGPCLGLQKEILRQDTRGNKTLRLASPSPWRPNVTVVDCSGRGESN